MIYLGVDILPDKFNITALSDEYIFIDSRVFNYSRLHKVDQWIDDCKDIFDKNVKWFFDEHQFRKCKTAKRAKFTAYADDFFLVDHHQLIKIIKFMYDYMFHANCIIPMDKAFFLASAQRLIDDSFISFYNTNIDDLPF
jgi:hypothetical protein